MAKTAKIKKKPVTIHSRAARRATSPSIDVSKSAKPSNAKRDSASPSRPAKVNPHALAAKNAGVQKKQKKSNMTRAQKLRYQRGLERAEENLDKLELKRAKSSGKGKKVRERAKGWDDINASGTKKTKHGNASDAMDEDRRQEREWVSDEEMDGNDLSAHSEGQDEGKVKGQGKQVEALVPERVPLPIPVEEDEML